MVYGNKLVTVDPLSLSSFFSLLHPLLFFSWWRVLQQDMPARSPEHIKKILTIPTNYDDDDTSRDIPSKQFEMKDNVLRFLMPQFEYTNRFQDKDSPIMKWLSTVFGGIKTNIPAGYWSILIIQYIFISCRTGPRLTTFLHFRIVVLFRVSTNVLKGGDWDKCPDEFVFSRHDNGNSDWFWTCYHSLSSVSEFLDPI